MVVIGIVAIVVGVGAYNITRSRRRVSLERATEQLASRVQKAQALAAVAGSRLGPVRDPQPGRGQRLAYGANCTADPTLQLWVRFLPGQRVEIPAELVYDDATDVLTVNCEIFDLTAVTSGLGTIGLPAPGAVFGFSPAGRLIVPAGAPAPIFVQLVGTTDNHTYGFRVLPSGIVCRASTVGGALCDQETG